MMRDNLIVRIIKSEIPIIWLDTSIITYMTQWKYGLCKLAKIKESRISRLYNMIYENSRKGKIICPLSEQDGEIWIEREKWLSTINKLSLGIKTQTLQSIHDRQFYIFMKAFVNNEMEITINYNDAFYSDPVKKLRENLQSRFLVTVNSPILFGKEYQKNKKKDINRALNEQRERNVDNKVTFERQIEAEYLGSLEAKLIQLRQFMTNQFNDEEDRINSIWGALNLGKQFWMWEKVSRKHGNFEGLIAFYKSTYYREMPYTKLSCNLFAKMMTDKQPIRSGDEMDIKHVSTIMPFCNIFITDRAMSAFLRKRKFDELYDSTVCYMGDTRIIDGFFSNL